MIGHIEVETIDRAQLLEYISVSPEDWNDLRAVMVSRGLTVSYSVEEGIDGMEYHVYSHIDEVEDILWAIGVLDNSNCPGAGTKETRC